MAASVINETLSFNNRFDIIKGMMYIKLLQKNIILPKNDLNLLCLFAFNSDKDEVINQAIELGYVKSFQTGDNTVSRLVVKYKLLEKEGDKKRKLTQDFYFFIETDYIGATFKLHNLNTLHA